MNCLMIQSFMQERLEKNAAGKGYSRTALVLIDTNDSICELDQNPIQVIRQIPFMEVPVPVNLLIGRDWSHKHITNNIFIRDYWLATITDQMEGGGGGGGGGEGWVLKLKQILIITSMDRLFLFQYVIMFQSKYINLSKLTIIFYDCQRIKIYIFIADTSIVCSLTSKQFTDIASGFLISFRGKIGELEDLGQEKIPTFFLWNSRRYFWRVQEGAQAQAAPRFSNQVVVIYSHIELIGLEIITATCISQILFFSETEKLSIHVEDENVGDEISIEMTGDGTRILKIMINFQWYCCVHFISICGYLHLHIE
ncbi:hypothetical protein ACJX0J_027150 [Zea mays]